MIKNIRHTKIMELLEQQETISVAELSKILDCSMMTVRRDLEYLSQLPLVKKIHGGVTIPEEDKGQPSFTRRIIEHPDEKDRIAIEACSRIHSGDTVFFDAGTSPLFVVKNLPRDIAFTAITNSLMTAIELCKYPNVSLIMIGGEIHHSSHSAVNNMAIEASRKFHTDTAIISTKSISVPDGLYETNLSLIEIKRTLVQNAANVILVADYSKFSNRAMCFSVPLQDVHEIITDRRTPAELIEEIKKSGVRVTVV